MSDAVLSSFVCDSSGGQASLDQAVCRLHISTQHKLCLGVVQTGCINHIHTQLLASSAKVCVLCRQLASFLIQWNQRSLYHFPHSLLHGAQGVQRRASNVSADALCNG